MKKPKTLRKLNEEDLLKGTEFWLLQQARYFKSINKDIEKKGEVEKKKSYYLNNSVRIKFIKALIGLSEKSFRKMVK